MPRNHMNKRALDRIASEPASQWRHRIVSQQEATRIAAADLLRIMPRQTSRPVIALATVSDAPQKELGITHLTGATVLSGIACGAVSLAERAPRWRRAQIPDRAAQ
jgi:hypothetical protein